MGFENTFYQVREDTGNIVICAVIIQPAISINPIEFSFEVDFAANSETASKDELSAHKSFNINVVHYIMNNKVPILPCKTVVIFLLIALNISFSHTIFSKM